MKYRTFYVQFQVPEVELATYREVMEAPGLSPKTTFVEILQRDLYDEAGMSGEFRVIEDPLGSTLVDAHDSAVKMAYRNGSKAGWHNGFKEGRSTVGSGWWVTSFTVATLLGAAFGTSIVTGITYLNGGF